MEAARTVGELRQVASNTKAITGRQPMDSPARKLQRKNSRRSVDHVRREARWAARAAAKAERETTRRDL